MPDAYRFASGPLQLVGHLVTPPGRTASGVPGLVLAHHFHTGAGGAAATAETYPELADRIATELGWYVLTFTCRGAGESEGQFSLGGWLADIEAAVDHLCGLDGLSGVWLAGFGTGAALSICAGARDPRVKGVAVLGGPADFDDWAGQPRRLLEYARQVGVGATDRHRRRGEPPVGSQAHDGHTHHAVVDGFDDRPARHRRSVARAHGRVLRAHQPRVGHCRDHRGHR